jgi:RHS repeat-associated protein
MSTSGAPTNYLYNALGQMIEKSGTLGTVIFMQDEAGHLIGEYDGSGNLIEETVWLGDIPVATLQPNGSGGLNIFYVHTDHLNTPRKVAQPTTAQLTWRWDTDPFGSTPPNQNPSGLGTFSYNLRLPGQYYDAETGLNQNWNRDYDPLIGKYVESDQIGLHGGGFSTYLYVGGNPLRRRDPRGLFWDQYGTYTAANAAAEATGVSVGVAAAGVTGAAALGLGIGFGINAAVQYFGGDSIGGFVYSWTHPQSALPATAPAAPPGQPPSAANDPSFGDGCPPNCQARKMALDETYRMLTRVEESPLQGTLDIYWSNFWKEVAHYEQDCGPYEPPPTKSFHDAYTYP